MRHEADAFKSLVLQLRIVKITYLQTQYEDIEDHLPSKHLLRHKLQVLMHHLFPCILINRMFIHEVEHERTNIKVIINRNNQVAYEMPNITF